MTKNDQIAQSIGNDRPYKDAEEAQAATEGRYQDKAPSVRVVPPPSGAPNPFGSIRR